MPKKQKQHYLSKPATSYVHPSLASSAAPREAAAPASVNDRLEYLRRAQGHQVSQKDLSFSQYAPRPVNRRLAGPPPPRSWLVATSSGDDDGAVNGADPLGNRDRPRPPCIDSFPGPSMPPRDSLMHQLLESIAKDIEWHAEFDGAYLALLPLKSRTQLLSYIAFLGPSEGMSLTALKALFAIDGDLEAQGAARPEEFTRLDLGGSVGRGIVLKELEKSWSRKAKAKQAAERLVDSWEEEVDLASLTLESPLWFPSLTHLSLAYPASSVSWNDLLRFSRSLSALTHLSLAGWPRPALPLAAGAPTLGEPQSSTAEEGEGDDARGILRVFSRNTASLEWISFSRCHDWLDDLIPTRRRAGRVPAGRPRRMLGAAAAQQAVLFEDHDGPTATAPGAGEEGAEWTGSWRHVRHVELSQEWVPAGLTSRDLTDLLRGRTQTVHGPLWATGPRPPPREPEPYRIIAPTEEIRRSIEQQRGRRDWIDKESRALGLAAKVRTLRMHHGSPRCEFDHGWGKTELLMAGYDERVLFEAGL